ncbi:MAG TPA: type III secretion system cytoplasmic ring protein SctQ [Chthoniobacterales bacterium]
MIPPRGYSVAAVSFPLRSENRETVELFNKTVGVHRDISFQVGGKEWRLTLERPPPPFQPAFEIAVTLGGHPLIVGFSGTLPQEWLPPGLAGVDLSALPEDVGRAVREATLQPLVDKAFSGAGKLISNPPPQPDDHRAVTFGWAVAGESDAQVISGRVTMPEAALPALAASLSRAPGRAARDFAGLRIRTCFEVGITQMTLREIRSLRRGDIALLDEAYSILTSGNGFLIVADGWRLPIARDGTHITITGTLTPMADPKTRDSIPTGEQEPSSLDELPIRLSFTVGEVEMTLGELRQLQPGFTFELNRPASQPVVVRAQGQTIGSGEIVRIGDMIGVRLTEIAGN